MNFLSAFILALLLNGCVPKVKTTVPSVEGKVIHSITNQPIADVNISGTYSTDKNGHFMIPETQEVSIGTPMGGIWMISRLFSIQKEGYIPLSCTCETLNSSGYCTNVTISLTPKNERITRKSISVSSKVSCFPTILKNLQ